MIEAERVGWLSVRKLVLETKRYNVMLHTTQRKACDSHDFMDAVIIHAKVQGSDRDEVVAWRSS